MHRLVLSCGWASAPAPTACLLMSMLGNGAVGRSGSSREQLRHALDPVAVGRSGSLPHMTRADLRISIELQGRRGCPSAV